MIDDQAALKLSMDRAMAKGEATRVQLQAKLKDESWQDVAEFACYCCQTDALNLKPWQEPPCVVSEDGPERDKEAQKLLQKMLAAGISRYDPDPMAALAKTKRKRSAAP